MIDAVKSGSVGLVEQYIRNMGPAGDAGTNVFYTASVSSVFDGMANVVGVILDKSSLQVDQQGITGNSLLMWAAYFGQTAIVKNLIKRNANALLKNNDGDTAITLARKQGYSDIVTLLRTYQGSD